MCGTTRVGTPAAVAEGKIKKQPGGDGGLVLELVRTADILTDVAAHPRRPRLVVGFAAETGELEANALDKLRRKRVDMIAGNRVGVAGSGFEADDNTLHVLSAEGTQVLGPGPKASVAEALLDLVAARLR